MKHLAILVALIILAGGNPGKEQNRPDLPQYYGTYHALPVAAFFPRDEATSPDTQTGDSDTPHWYTVPEWWICILGVPTLIFVGIQSYLMRVHAGHFKELAQKTADAAKATQASANATNAAAQASRDAIILQHRPRLRVRSLRLIQPNNNEFEMRMVIRNSGETVAHVQESSLEIIWMQSGEAKETHTKKIERVSLKAGQAKAIVFTVPEYYVRFRASQLILDENPGQPQTAYLSCGGAIIYTDDIGTRRETGVARLYYFRKKRFEVEDIEADYSD